MHKYYSFEECISLIKEPNLNKCQQIMRDYEKIINSAQGSKSKHQAWPGGYLDHLTETMNLALQIYPVLNNCRPLPFTVEDAILVLFLHDKEKPFKQRKSLETKLENAHGKKDDTAIKSFKEDLIKKYEIELTADQQNALKYAEGEGKDYDPHKRIQGPLAAFVHMCDNISARIWYDFPAQSNDPWSGAHRSKA